jgi:hypothetical protein
MSNMHLVENERFNIFSIYMLIRQIWRHFMYNLVQHMYTSDVYNVCVLGTRPSIYVYFHIWLFGMPATGTMLLTNRHENVYIHYKIQDTRRCI